MPGEDIRTNRVNLEYGNKEQLVGPGFTKNSGWIDVRGYAKLLYSANCNINLDVDIVWTWDDPDAGTPDIYVVEPPNTIPLNTPSAIIISSVAGWAKVTFTGAGITTKCIISASGRAV